MNELGGLLYAYDICSNQWLLVLETYWIQFFPQRRFAAGHMITSGLMTGNEAFFQQPIKYGHFRIWAGSLPNRWSRERWLWQQDWLWLTFVILYPGFNQWWASLPGFIHTIKSPGFPVIKGSSLPPTISTSACKISPKKKYEWFRALNPEV